MTQAQSGLRNRLLLHSPDGIAYAADMMDVNLDSTGSGDDPEAQDFIAVTDTTNITQTRIIKER